MDLYAQLGLLSLAAATASLMLYFLAGSLESMENTKNYVTEQNYSDAYATRYASLASFDAETVGKISAQEALTLIFKEATNDKPIFVKEPSGTIRAYVTGAGGWTYDSYGKRVGAKYNPDGTLDTATAFNTDLGVLNIVTTKVPEYAELHKRLSNNFTNNKKYVVNIDPFNDNSLNFIVIIAVD